MPDEGGTVDKRKDWRDTPQEKWHERSRSSMLGIRCYSGVKQRFMDYSSLFPSHGAALESLLDLVDERGD